MVLTPTDIYPIVNKMVKIQTGVDSISVVDASTFAQAMELVNSSATTENTLHTLTEIIGETFFADRNYTAKLSLINSTRQGYTSRYRKISYYSRGNEATGCYNTNLNDSNLMTGVDNTGAGTEGVTGARSASMWKQDAPVVLEAIAGGRKTLQKRATIYEEALKVAMRDENEFARFVSGIMTEVGNDIETNKQAENALLINSFMAGLYDMDGGAGKRAINLLKEFNTRYSTNYDVDELLNEHATEFLEFFVAYVKNLTAMMEYRTTEYHYDPVKTVGGVDYHLLRFTPKAKMKSVFYEPLFTFAKTKVFPEIFHTDMLDYKNYEGVMFWQSPQDGAKIQIKPNVLDTDTGLSKAGNEVKLDYVVGMIFDTDALMVNYQLDRVAETPLEASKLYRNVIWHWSKSYIMDYTENAVMLYLANEE